MASSVLLVAAVCVVVLVGYSAAQSSPAPVIGILTQPYNYNEPLPAYIAASYVKVCQIELL